MGIVKNILYTLEDYLVQIKIADEQNTNNNAHQNDSIEVRKGSKHFGHYYKKPFFDAISSEQYYIDPQLEIRDSGTSQWYHVLSHPLVYRRKTKTDDIKISCENVALLLMVEGQAKGPYSMDEIRQMLRDKDILYTDLVSPDQGQEWIKIYQIDKLDRRSTSDLPPVPSEAIDDESSAVRHIINEQQLLLKENTKVVASFAFLGSTQSGRSFKEIAKKKAAQTPTTPSEDDMPLVFYNSNRKRKRGSTIILILATLVGLSWSLFEFYNAEIKTDKILDQKNADIKSMNKSKVYRPQKIELEKQSDKRAFGTNNSISDQRAKTNSTRGLKPSVQTNKIFHGPSPEELREKREQERREREEARIEREENREADRDLMDQDQDDEDGVNGERKSQKKKRPTSKREKSRIAEDRDSEFLDPEELDLLREVNSNSNNDLIRGADELPDQEEGLFEQTEGIFEEESVY